MAPDLIWLARSLAEGIASVHAAGVLHRDVKPSNVLMEGRTPILIDFGLARVADDPKLTHTGWLLGTPGYLPPEILHGDDATTASDVHSWAATVAYAALGRPPYGSGPSMAIMDRVRRGEHDLTGLPDALRALLAAALDPDPARRPTLDRIRRLLDPDADPRTPLPEAPPEDAEDLFTMPLAIAAQAGVLPRVEPDDAVTEVRPTLVDPEPPAVPGPDGSAPAVQEDFWDDHWHDHRGLPPQGWVAPPPEPPAPRAERARRALLARRRCGRAAAGVAAYPYLVPWPCSLLVWLLRSGSLTASATGDRQRVRGARVVRRRRSRRCRRPGTWCGRSRPRCCSSSGPAASRSRPGCSATRSRCHSSSRLFVSAARPGGRAVPAPAARGSAARWRGWSSR